MEIDSSFTIRDLSSKCRSKTELYKRQERGSDLSSPKQDATQEFL